MQSADATFKLLTVDIKDVDSSTDGLTAKMTLLEERLRLQNQAVQEYQNILSGFVANIIISPLTTTCNTIDNGVHDMTKGKIKYGKNSKQKNDL